MESLFAYLPSLGALKNEGLLDADEFAALKKRLLEDNVVPLICSDPKKLRLLKKYRDQDYLDANEFATQKKALLAKDLSIPIAASPVAIEPMDNGVAGKIDGKIDRLEHAVCLLTELVHESSKRPLAQVCLPHLAGRRNCFVHLIECCLSVYLRENGRRELNLLYSTRVFLCHRWALHQVHRVLRPNVAPQIQP